MCTVISLATGYSYPCFVSSCLDYFIALYSDLSQYAITKLQLFQNYAVNLLTKSYRSHIT